MSLPAANNFMGGGSIPSLLLYPKLGVQVNRADSWTPEDSIFKLPAPSEKRVHAEGLRCGNRPPHFPGAPEGLNGVQVS